MQITLKPVKSSAKVFKYLEKKGLISVLKPTDKALKTRTKTPATDKAFNIPEKENIRPKIFSDVPSMSFMVDLLKSFDYHVF